MGLFDADQDVENEEVRIHVPEESSGKTGSRLEDEAKDKLTDDSSDVTLEDVHRQNKEILQLLRDKFGEEESGSSGTDQDRDLNGGGMDGIL
ncbi:MAG: hypothetical protein ABEJ83_04210 [Candidatus Nanohaloarchaea archaeon]